MNTVPDYSHVPKQLHATGLFTLTVPDQEEAFTDATIATLNGLDPRWRHLKKSKAQTNVHRHGEDSALYCFPDGTAKAVDFIGGAGGPNPQPGWIVDNVTLYTHADGHDPDDHGLEDGAAPPATYPGYEELGGDAGGQAITRQLEKDFKRSGRPGLDGNCGAWQQRVAYDFLTGKVVPVEASVTKHRDGWLMALGLILVETGLTSEARRCLICDATVAYPKGTEPKLIPHTPGCTQ